MKKHLGLNHKNLHKRIEEWDKKIESLKETLQCLSVELGGIKETVLSATEEENVATSRIDEQLPGKAVEEYNTEKHIPLEDTGKAVKDLVSFEPPSPVPSELKEEEKSPEKDDGISPLKEPSPGLSTTLQSLNRDSTPKEQVIEAKSGMDLETRIGSIWFNRVGLVALVIGVALLGRMVTPYLEPWHKVIISYLGAGFLFLSGWYYEERIRGFARPVMAGALAILFFTSFAAYFLKPMACVPLWGALVLMSISVGLVFFCAEWWRSEPIAGFAIFLGNVAAYVAGGQSDTFALVAILFLTVMAFGLFLRHDWLPLSLFSVIAAFSVHLLWALQDHPPSTQMFRFWINFQFLTAYYSIFLMADLIYHQRAFVRGIETYSMKQRLAGRCIGPAAMILYVSMTGGLFHVTKIYWGQIHFFFFPLAALQIFMFQYHRKRNNTDYPLYAAAATLFTVLALFSWMECLMLNMLLAAEALLLLVLGRQMQFGFLSILAQLVLIINLIHFFGSEARTISTWPSFLGSVMVAVIYFVKSRLEETWHTIEQRENVLEARWARILRQKFEEQAKSLAVIHALVGAFLLWYQCREFFNPQWESLALAGFAIAAMIISCLLKSSAMVSATCALQVGCVILIARHLQTSQDHLIFMLGNSAIDVNTLCFTDQIASISILAATLVVGVISIVWRRPHASVLGTLSVFLVAPLLFVPAKVEDPITPAAFIWYLSALILWAKIELLEKYFQNQELPAGDTFLATTFQWIKKSLSFLRAAQAIIAALLSGWIIHLVFPTAHTAVLVYSLALLPVLVWTMYKDSVYLLLGFAAFLVLATDYFITIYKPALGPDNILSWWFFTVIVGGACAQSVMSLRRIGYYEVFFLAAMSAALSILLYLWTYTGFYFEPFALWLAAISGLWVAAELIQRYLNRLNSSIHVPVLSSLAAAVLLILLSSRYLEYKFEYQGALCWAVIIYATLFFLLGFFLKSPTLAAASILFFSGAHVVFHFQLAEIGIGVVHYPVLAAVLFACSLFLGAATEKFLQSKEDELSPSRKIQIKTCSWYPYVLGFFLVAIFFEHHDQMASQPGNWIFLGTAFRFPAQMLFGCLGITMGWRFQLPRMQLVSCGYLVLIIANMLYWAGNYSIYQKNLLLAGIPVFIVVIVSERIISRQSPDILKQLHQELAQRLGQILQIGTGAFMLGIVQLSDFVQGYWTTVGWSFVALLLMVLGFLWREQTYRRSALVIFVLSILRIVIFDIRNLDSLYRMFAFVTLGTCLILVSFLYSRFQERVKRWL